MSLAHYDALTARAFDDATPDHQVAAHDQQVQQVQQVSQVAAALGRVLLHLGVPALGMLALWLNT